MKFGRIGVSITWMFMWTEEEVKRYLPDKISGWALDALNYLPNEFWKFDQKFRAWTLQETLYFFNLRLSSFPMMHEDAFGRYLIEKEEYEEEVLQSEINKPVFHVRLLTEKSSGTSFKWCYSQFSYEQKTSKKFFD